MSKMALVMFVAPIGLLCHCTPEMTARFDREIKAKNDHYHNAYERANLREPSPFNYQPRIERGDPNAPDSLSPIP